MTLTLAKAREQFYGRSYDQREPNYREGYCAKHVYDQIYPHQCTRKNGHGPNKLWCKQHDPEAVKARRAAQEAKWAAENEAEQEIYRRRSACIRACEGIPTEALEDGVVKELLESLKRISTITADVLNNQQLYTLERRFVSSLKGISDATIAKAKP